MLYLAAEDMHCFACGGPLKTIHSEDHYEVVCCSDCGLTHVMPLPTMESAVELYEDDPVIHFSHGRECVLAAFLRQAEAILGGPGRLLDIGCGAGTFLDFARRNGWQVSGVDINAAAIRSARENFQLDIRRGTIRDVSGSFDLITFMQAIEYISDSHEDMFARTAHLLTEDGLLGVETPNMNFHHLLLRFRAARSFDIAIRLAPDEASRLIAYTPTAITHLLRKAGFRDVSIRPGLPRQTGGAEGLIRNALYRGSSFLYWINHTWVISPTMFVFARK